MLSTIYIACRFSSVGHLQSAVVAELLGGAEYDHLVSLTATFSASTQQQRVVKYFTKLLDNEKKKKNIKHDKNKPISPPTHTLLGEGEGSTSAWCSDRRHDKTG